MIRPRAAAATVAALAAALVAERASAQDGPPAAGPAPVVVVDAERLAGWPGTVEGPGRLVLERGRAPRVSADAPPAGATVLRAAVATPGFLDGWSRPRGADGAEDPQPFGFALRLADGVDPWAPGAEGALREGVLARRALPSAGNPAGGAPCVVAFPARGVPPVVHHDGGAGVFSFAAAAARRERHPGSPAGLVSAMESAVDDVRGRRAPFAGADPALRWTEGDRAALGALMAASGGRAFLHAGSEPEVRAALRWSRAAGLRPVLVGPRCGAPRILAAVEECGEERARVSVLLALDVDDPTFLLRAPGELAAAGVEVRFGTASPDRPPGALRAAAALAVRHGMEPAAALRGLGGAECLAAAPGAVLLDGDPLDPRSRIVAVIRGGVVVHAAPPPAVREARR